jgi:hypothetical protein
VKGRAVIGLGDDGANIRGGDDAVHPGDRGGCAVSMRDSGAKRTCQEHRWATSLT